MGLTCYPGIFFNSVRSGMFIVKSAPGTFNPVGMVQLLSFFEQPIFFNLTLMIRKQKPYSIFPLTLVEINKTRNLNAAACKRLSWQ
jgi:hypothetical protein